MLYKYCDISGLDILTNARLRLSRLDSLNDPFEYVFNMDENSAEFNIRRDYAEQPDILKKWRQVLEENKINCDQDAPENILQKYIKFQISFLRSFPAVLREAFSEKLGIICMSEELDSIQMWAHYSDNHKGIVVGIEEREAIKKTNIIHTVCYRDKMVQMPITSDREELSAILSKYVHEVVSRKETHWSYEKEVRWTDSLQEICDDGHYYLNIPKHSIKELYLGLRTDSSIKPLVKEIKSNPAYSHLKVFKMEQHPSDFKLVPQEIFET